MGDTAVQNEPKRLFQSFSSSRTGALSQALSHLSMPTGQLPHFAVLGIQSSGKSSLLEMLLSECA